eukprot:200836-Chlamydomonas_euryale.AAC.5
MRRPRAVRAHSAKNLVRPFLPRQHCPCCTALAAEAQGRPEGRQEGHARAAGRRGRRGLADTWLPAVTNWPDGGSTRGRLAADRRRRSAAGDCWSATRTALPDNFLSHLETLRQARTAASSWRRPICSPPAHASPRPHIFDTLFKVRGFKCGCFRIRYW